tara:strand:+ start:4162 stop:4521 length:360 start_codon:yes stop_codon:yes gene_type:complete
MSYKDLLKEFNDAKRIADAKLKALRNYDSGYIWLVQICSYGSSHWREFKNIHGVQELCNEYGDGYDGLLYIYTTDLKAKSPVDCGCVSKFIKIPKQELDKLERTHKSKTEGLLSFLPKL